MSQQFDEVSQLLKVNSQKARGNVRLESDILEAAQSSQSYATFNLRKAGILSNDSRLVLPLYASNATTRLSMYGASFGMILNATLRTSDGTTIAQTTDSNYLSSIRNHWVPQEIRDRVGRYKNGTWNTFEYGVDSTSDQEGVYKVSNLVETAAGEYDQKARHRLGQTAADRVEYVISLKSLFPELLPFSIPLYCLEGNLQLFLEFAEQGAAGEVAIASNGVNADIGNVLIDLANLKFISDHVFMDQPVMQQLMAVTRTEKGLVVPYATYNEVVFTRLAPANPAANAKTEVTYQNSIGLSGLRVKHILVHDSEAAANGHNTDPQKIAGKYASADSFAGVNGQSLQIQLNNDNYYSQDITSQEFYREVEDVYGVAMSEPLPVYSTIGQVSDGTKGDAASNTLTRPMVSDDLVCSVAMSELIGSANIKGINFCNPLQRQNTGFNGLLVGNAPVQLTYKRFFTNNKATNLQSRVFICVERLMSIRNGKVLNNYS